MLMVVIIFLFFGVSQVKSYASDHDGGRNFFSICSCVVPFVVLIVVVKGFLVVVVLVI